MRFADTEIHFQILNNFLKNNYDTCLNNGKLNISNSGRKQKQETKHSKHSKFKRLSGKAS